MDQEWAGSNLTNHIYLKKFKVILKLC